LDSFCRAAERGRFPDLADADGLWRLLSRITARKAIDRIRRRSLEKEVGESALDGNESSRDGFPAVASHDPTPEIAIMFADQVRHAMERLQDRELEQVALAKLDGDTNEKIAGLFGCSVRTVERRLRLIRKIWEQEFEL
jgi:DNA-directed RNA polymerase specialized sigma24 family protein